MLRLNRETDYAIRVILALAQHPHDSIVPSQIIRQAMDLPKALSIQIISHLAHENLIKTYPGRKGGIQLALSPDKITLMDVVRVMEGPVVVSECLEDDHDCHLSPTCPVQKHWSKLQDMVEDQLASITFWDLVESVPFNGVVDVQ